VSAAAATPPPPAPAAHDLARILRFLRRSEEAVCDRVQPTAHGAAMLTPSLPLVWQLNAIHIDDPDASPEPLAREAELVQHAFAHRKLVVHDETLGARLAPRLEAMGWNVFRLLVMVQRRPPQREMTPGAGGEIARAEGAAALAAFRREQPFGWQEEAVRQLEAMDERYGRVLEAHDFASPPDDPACACRLYSDGELAQVDEVGTVEARRGRGHASAAVLAATAHAKAAGRHPIFLLTDANDWPQLLYGTLGFDAIGAVHEFLRLPLGAEHPARPGAQR
jgi:GNAT superfamily N-acetyltransferase